MTYSFLPNSTPAPGRVIVGTRIGISDSELADIRSHQVKTLSIFCSKNSKKNKAKSLPCAVKSAENQLAEKKSEIKSIVFPFLPTQSFYSAGKSSWQTRESVFLAFQQDFNSLLLWVIVQQLVHTSVDWIYLGRSGPPFSPFWTIFCWWAFALGRNGTYPECQSSWTGLQKVSTICKNNCNLPTIPYQIQFFFTLLTNVEALVGVRKFSRFETGMGASFRP